MKKGGEHEGRPEKAQEDAFVYNEEKNAELPETHEEPQHHGEPSACRGGRLLGQEAGSVLFAVEKSRTRKSYWIDLQELQSGGKPATIRSWKSFYTVLCGQLLCFLRLVDEISSLIKFNLKPNYFRDQEDFFEAKAASSPIMIYQVSLKKQVLNPKLCLLLHSEAKTVFPQTFIGKYFRVRLLIKH